MMENEDVDSDGSITWEEFISKKGSTSDLMPQLLSMFDEIARKGLDDAIISSTATSLKNRINKNCSSGGGGNVLLQRQMSPIAIDDENNNGQVEDDDEDEEDEEEDEDEDHIGDRKSKCSSTITERTTTGVPSKSGVVVVVANEKTSTRLNCNDSTVLAPLRFTRRCHNGVRPLSGSSIASSTSSSGCSNQGNVSTANPYLASVESLADTCTSSQGSGDSGVVTVSETSSRINGIAAHQSDSHSPRYSDWPRYCDPQRNPVERVLLEIVDTEAVYVEHLRQVIQGYLMFWRDDPASLFREFELVDLFSNIEDIFDFNRKFLYSLENCGLDPIAVANIFIKHNSGFKVYTEYCTNYPRTVSTITALMCHEALARAFRDRQAALGHALPLGSFLLKPVQRILKYHLLLQNLSKEFETRCTSRLSESSYNIGRKAIDDALEAMTGIAEHINAMKRKHEHAVRVQEIQSLLLGWLGPDLTTFGELIAEGTFRMRGARAPRHVFLFDKMFLLTKKKEYGLLVYKAHIMCSNLTLMESIPGEPLTFHVLPFDNSQCQYKLQARNLEQKREWTLQIKKTILENFNAVIPSHARQLVLQIGQNKTEDNSTSSKSRKRKPRKNHKSDLSWSGVDNYCLGSRKNQSSESISIFGLRDENLNRSSEVRGSKIKDRFTNWRRKSEPGFQLYVNLNIADDDVNLPKKLQNHKNPQNDHQQSNSCSTSTSSLQTPVTQINLEKIAKTDAATEPTVPSNKTLESETKEINNEAKIQTVEEIVGHILKQNQEFQRLFDKQRNGNNTRRQNRICHQKILTLDTSEDESDVENMNDSNRTRLTRRDQRLIRANNAYNQRSFRFQYDNYCNLDIRNSVLTSMTAPLSVSTPKEIVSTGEKTIPISSAKKPNIVSENQVARSAALNISKDLDEQISKNSMVTVFEGVSPLEESPTKPAVWLTKLCDVLPNPPKKCDSLPRSFQIGGCSPTNTMASGKPRLLQRDGKLMSDRPFTIASDKPAEINLEDMERYTTCQSSSSSQIAKFPNSCSSNSTFFCSLDDSSFTDTADSVSTNSGLSSTVHHHPEHKIYRASSSLRSVLSRAGSRLKSTLSSETLECGSEDGLEKSFSGYLKVLSRSKHKTSDTEESSGIYQHKQGSTTLGARIAQPDYADPSILFANSRRNLCNKESSCNSVEIEEMKEEEVEEEADGFYEKSFDDIEKYADGEEAFRDSAIFSDVDESSLKSFVETCTIEEEQVASMVKLQKPVVTKKPEHLKFKKKIVKHIGSNGYVTSPIITIENVKESNGGTFSEKVDIGSDVSAGQSQIGWVKKMVVQLQARIET